MSILEAIALFIAMVGSIAWLGAAIAWCIATIARRMDDAQEHRRNLARYRRGTNTGRYRV